MNELIDKVLEGVDPQEVISDLLSEATFKRGQKVTVKGIPGLVMAVHKGLRHIDIRFFDSEYVKEI